jgi:ferric-dicitrate binding protein FerR (iron transport regulator)
MSGDNTPMQGSMRDDGMDNDYLWDRSGPVYPEIARLERLLGAHAHADAPRRVRSAIRAKPAQNSRRRRWRAAFAAAAVVAVCAIGTRAWFQQRLQWEAGEPWQVIAQQGDVRIDGRARQARALALDGTLETGANAMTRLRAAGIGEVAIGAGSRLRLIETRTGRHRVQLEQGSLWARVWAPPGQFGVGVAGAEVIDLGCEFLLKVDADGNGSLSVLSGWVQVDNLQREVLVPQGTRVRVNGDGAAGTPHAFSATLGFIAALEAIDARNGDVDPHGDEVRRLLAESRPQDAISLLALLRDYPRLAEGPLFDRLASLLPTPLATRDAWSSDRMAALNAWWDALPYPRVKRWWTQWPDALPSRNGKMTQWLQAQDNG